RWCRWPERAADRVGQPDPAELPCARSGGGQGVCRQEHHTVSVRSAKPCAGASARHGQDWAVAPDGATGARPDVLDGVLEQGQSGQGW
ncbi:hypothetical protein ABTF71_19450, partial [Acinetobacter baumannii]